MLLNQEYADYVKETVDSGNTPLSFNVWKETL